MLFVALSESADRGQLLLVDGGLCRYHLRKDGAVTIREIIVLPASRGKGIGRALVGAVLRQCPGAVVRARCPADYPANGFWERMGFQKQPTTGGVNLWERLA